MKKIGWRAWVLFATAFIATLTITAPATLVAKIVEVSSNGQFVLANAAGSVWQGSATAAIRKRSGTLLALEKLHWDVAVLTLFTGKIVTRLHWGDGMQGQPMEVSISLAQTEFHNAVISLPAAMIAELIPMLQPVQLSGNIQVQSEQLVFSKQGISGFALAQWMNAGSVLSTVNPLGNYSINLAGAGERLDIVLATISGPLLLDGSGSFTREQGLTFQATARASAESKGSLDELLNNLGPESAPGVHSLKLMR